MRRNRNNQKDNDKKLDFSSPLDGPKRRQEELQSQKRKRPEIETPKLGFWQNWDRRFRVTIPGTLIILGAIGATYYFTHRGGEEKGITEGKQQAEEVYNPLLSEAEKKVTKADSTREEAELIALAAVEQSKEDSLARIKADSVAQAAIRQAQQTAIAAQERENNVIKNWVTVYDSTYPRFNLLVDYVIDGPRSFHTKKLPWSTSLDNLAFISYATNPTKNIEDFLKIKNLGEQGYVPQTSINEFFNGEFDIYIGDVPGEIARSQYNEENAVNGTLYGIKRKNGKTIGFDELAKKEVKYTGPTRSEIKQKTKKLRIKRPEGF